MLILVVFVLDFSVYNLIGLQTEARAEFRAVDFNSVLWRFNGSGSSWCYL